MRMYSGLKRKQHSYARHRCHSANIALLQGVDNAALANIGISDKTNRDLLISELKSSQLPEEAIREPLPKEWFGETWKARVGNCGVR